MRDELLERIEQLSFEIRHYPTPIARCDEQLTALLDERSRLLVLLETNEKRANSCTPEALWVNDGGMTA